MARLIADYAERAQALAVAAELLVDTISQARESDWRAAWYAVERARIKCDIAHLAVETHLDIRRFEEV